MSKKQKKKLGKLGKILLSIVGVLILSLASLPFVVGRFLSTEYIEETIEKELRCEANVGELKRRLFALGGSGRIELRELEIKLQDSAITELLEQSELNESELELAEKILREPVLLAESAELRFRRLPLFQGRLEVESLSIGRLEFFVHEIKGLGTNLQGFEKPKAEKETAENQPKPEDELAKTKEEKPSSEPDPSKEEEQFKLDLQQLTLENGYFEFTSTDPRDQEAAQDALSYSVRDIQLSISGFSQSGTAALDVPVELAAQLAIDKGGAEQRIAQLELDGQGKLHWPAGAKREFEQISWEADFVASQDSFVRLTELANKFNGTASTVMTTLGIEEKWEIPTVLNFLDLGQIQLSGQAESLTLRNQPRLGMAGTILSLKQGSTIFFNEQRKHEISLLVQAPQLISSFALKQVPKRLKQVGNEEKWPEFQQGFFQEDKLVLTFTSQEKGTDFDFELTPDIEEIITAEEAIEGLMEKLLKDLLESAAE